MSFGDAEGVKVLIVADHASARFGGEAALPLHYFRMLRNRRVSVTLLVHERTREELETLFPDGRDRMVFIRDNLFHRVLWQIGRRLPARISMLTTGFASRLITQLAQRKCIRQMVRDGMITVIHQPMPVSPREPSLLFGLGVPVVIGPLNGGMNYPPAFRHAQGFWETLAVFTSRWLSTLVNWLLPGKRLAALVLVANERTRSALPRGVFSRLGPVVENGVDLAIWSRRQPATEKASSSITRFVFMGRLVDWKGVALLLRAFERAAAQAPMSLVIIGDGAERNALELQVKNSGLPLGGGGPGGVSFLGWISQTQCAEELEQSDAMVLPSLLECGGAAVLEGMAMELPVIATAWGGPLDYLDASCGILVAPTTEELLIAEFTSAMVRLAVSPGERIAMGRAGREKVLRNFDWDAKLDNMLAIYQRVL